MDKRYQVFVSSTFQDLVDERQEVMQALLELDCIPSGMELFPAANQDQWTLIKKVIDDCDYYVVISAGRYGSLGPDGIGFTEMEYRYALESGKPILGFLHSDPLQLPGHRIEHSDEGKTRLAAFRDLIRTKPVRFWDGPADLGSKVSRSLVQLIKAQPAVGWIRADAQPEDLTREVLTLRREAEELRKALAEIQQAAPEGSEKLAQGKELHVIQMQIHASVVGESRSDWMSYGFSTSWNEIFGAIAPIMINEASDRELGNALTNFLRDIGTDALIRDPQIESYKSELHYWTLLNGELDTVKVQLKALGLIEQSRKPRSVRDTTTYWTLTSRGDALMTTLRAIKSDTTSAIQTVPAD